MGQARARAMRHRSVGLAESSALSVFPLMAAGEVPAKPAPPHLRPSPCGGNPWKGGAGYVPPRV